MAKPGISPRNISHSGHSALTRRERQIMDILYRRGRATAGEVMEELSGDPTTRPSVQPAYRREGHVHHEEHGLRYHAGRAAQFGAQVRAAASRRHVFRRLGRAPSRRFSAAKARSCPTNNSIASRIS
jgi:hypothetical protein